MGDYYNHIGTTYASPTRHVSYLWAAAERVRTDPASDDDEHIQAGAPEDGRDRQASATWPDPCRSCPDLSRNAAGKPAPPEPEGDVYQQDQHRHFDQRANDCREGNRRGKPEGGEGNRERAFEIVAHGRERHCRRERIIRPDQLAHEESEQEM